MKPLAEGEDNLKNETTELIKYLYRKSEELSPFWEKHGLTYNDICKDLLSKNIIIDKNGKYELSKSLGSPQAAKEALETELKTLIGTDDQSEPQEVIGQTEPEMETEDSNYPSGTEHDSNAPWKEKDEEPTEPKQPVEHQLDVVAINKEVAILKAPDGGLFVFYYHDIPKEKFAEYASLTRHYVGKDEEGKADYEYDEDFDIDANVISNFVNDNLVSLSKAEGLEAYETGKYDLVKIDEPLKTDLYNIYDKDKSIAKVLGPIEENGIEPWDALKTNIQAAATKQPSSEPADVRQSKIVAKLTQLRDEEKARREVEQTSTDIEEMTGAASAGAFTPALDIPVIKREMPDTPVVSEVGVAGAGNFQYDAPALANVGRNGEFKDGPKTKAEKTVQYPKGSFVKAGKCTKLDNNKIAQNGGCNQGAGDAVSYQKGKGSVISPSLSENEIYAKIARETGKSLDEIKKIIESKKKKA
jgi:hypothetical protein